MSRKRRGRAGNVCRLADVSIHVRARLSLQTMSTPERSPMPAATDSAPISYRAPTGDDAPAVAALIAACDQAIVGESAYQDELTVLRNSWSSGVNLASDAWVAVASDSQIVGYELVEDLDQPVAVTDGCVHPDYCRLGIGTALLRNAEARARQAGAAGSHEPDRQLQVSIYASDDAGRALVLAEGFQQVRSFWQMRITMDALPA